IIITVRRIYISLRLKYSVIITVRKIYEGLRSKYSVIITVLRIYESLRSKYSVIITVLRIYESLRCNYYGQFIFAFISLLIFYFEIYHLINARFSEVFCSLMSIFTINKT